MSSTNYYYENEYLDNDNTDGESYYTYNMSNHYQGQAEANHDFVEHLNHQDERIEDAIKTEASTRGIVKSKLNFIVCLGVFLVTICTTILLIMLCPYIKKYLDERPGVPEGPQGPAGAILKYDLLSNSDDGLSYPNQHFGAFVAKESPPGKFNNEEQAYTLDAVTQDASGEITIKAEKHENGSIISGKLESIKVIKQSLIINYTFKFCT